MYKYLHTNGKIISKSDFVVGNPHEYFESDFVVAWWHFNDKTGLIDNQFPMYKDWKDEYDN